MPLASDVSVQHVKLAPPSWLHCLNKHCKLLTQVICANSRECNIILEYFKNEFAFDLIVKQLLMFFANRLVLLLRFVQFQIPQYCLVNYRLISLT